MYSYRYRYVIGVTIHFQYDCILHTQSALYIPHYCQCCVVALLCDLFSRVNVVEGESVVQGEIVETQARLELTVNLEDLVLG